MFFRRRKAGKPQAEEEGEFKNPRELLFEGINTGYFLGENEDNTTLILLPGSKEGKFRFPTDKEVEKFIQICEEINNKTISGANKEDKKESK